VAVTSGGLLIEGEDEAVHPVEAVEAEEYEGAAVEKAIDLTRMVEAFLPKKYAV